MNFMGIVITHFHLTALVIPEPDPGVGGDPRTGGLVPATIFQIPIVTVLRSAAVGGAAVPLDGRVLGDLSPGPEDGTVIGAMGGATDGLLGTGRVPLQLPVLHAVVRAALALQGDVGDNTVRHGAELELLYQRPLPALSRFLSRLLYRLCQRSPRFVIRMWLHFRALCPDADPSGQPFPAFLWDLVETQ